MSSKQVIDREKSASAVAAVGETQAEATGIALGKLLKPFVAKGEAAPNFTMVLLLVARAIEGAKGRMVDADAAHEAELGDDDGVRAARDAACEALSDKLVELREVLTGAFGATTASSILAGPTPQDPVVLARFANEVVTALGRIKLPAPRIKGAKLDKAETAAEIADLRSALDTQLKGVAREVREAQATLEAKNQEIAAYDAIFTGGAKALEGLLLLAGKAELAAKVKPSSRRPGQTASDAGDEAGTPPVET